jgi:hypothetical protein
MFNGDYSLVNRCWGMVEETVWVEKKYVRPRLNSFFESIVEVPRIRRGNRQTVETLINEEALQLARYLRSEKPTWNPRIVELS